MAKTLEAKVTIVTLKARAKVMTLKAKAKARPSRPRPTKATKFVLEDPRSGQGLTSMTACNVM
jgi:hypothetical protein